MNIVDKYYMRKASMGQNDEFYQELEKRDIEIMKRAQVYLFVAPTLTMGFVFVLNKLRYELLMSQHFFYLIKKYQDKMQQKYQRKRGPGDQRQDQEQEAAEKTQDRSKNLYKDIEKEKQEEEKARLETLKAKEAENIGTQQQTIRNIDPFEKKRRQAMLADENR